MRPISRKERKRPGQETMILDHSLLARPRKGVAVFPYMNYIGLHGLKGSLFSAVLVINRSSIDLAILLLNRVWVVSALQTKLPSSSLSTRHKQIMSRATVSAGNGDK